MSTPPPSASAASSCRSSRRRRRRARSAPMTAPPPILFGAERSGLETDEVALAGKIVTVPVNPDFRSLNLAQAVILIAYEWSKHEALAVPTAGRRGRAARQPRPARRADRPARRGAGRRPTISIRPTARRRRRTRSAPSSPRRAGRPRDPGAARHRPGAGRPAGSESHRALNLTHSNADEIRRRRAVSSWVARTEALVVSPALVTSGMTAAMRGFAPGCRRWR